MHNPDSTEIKKALPHVRYEIEELCKAGSKLPAHFQGIYRIENPNEIHPFEPFLLHARNLIEFFRRTERSKKHGDEILALDYCFDCKHHPPSTEWNKIDWDDVRNEISQHLAHLTYARVDRRNAENEWQELLRKVSYPLRERCVEFVRHVATRGIHTAGIDVEESELKKWDKLTQDLAKWGIYPS